MRRLETHTAIGWLYKQDPGAWAIYVAARYNPDRNKQIAAMATDEQRRLIRQAYKEDAKHERADARDQSAAGRA